MYMELINRIKAIFFGGKSSPSKKSNVLIFGASQGGISVCQSLRGSCNIIGFVDNNPQLHGTVLLGKKIFSPREINGLKYDKLIIASDYRKEIYAQLTDELNVSKELISIFSLSDTSKTSSFFSGASDTVYQYITDFICNQAIFNSKLLLSLLSIISNRFDSVELRKITWLDQLDSHKVKIFRELAQGKSFAPQFIDQEQKIKSVIVPEVSLYRFQKGRIMTAVNGIVFNDSDIAIARVPSFPVKYAQYSAAFLTAHGSVNALVRKYSSIQIERGIAIVGSNDTNYYHWVIEVLSKFQFIAELPEEYDDFPILISEQALKIDSIQAYISYFSISRKIIYLQSCIEYQVDDLLFISSANYFVANLRSGQHWSAESNFVREDSLKYLRNSALKALDNEAENITPLRVFLARKGIIRDYNQAEVFDLLYHYGFEAVYLEDLNLLQQVKLMQNAEVIVGPTGAAWTNLIFCNPGTRALCWMAEEIGDFACFSNLAQFSGVNMEYFCYQAAKKDSRELYHTNYFVDLNLIKHWLENIA